MKSADGVSIYADFYPLPGGESVRKDQSVILLFHQAGSNAGEYGSIAPRLVSMGFACLALDQRSGGRLWGRNNRTVVKLGKSKDFPSAYADLETALAWAGARGYQRIVVWGSSYTAALVFRLAAEHQGLAALLAFSPGEYLGPGEPVRAWAEKVHTPVFISSAPAEREVHAARRIFRAVAAAAKRQYVPQKGVHGASLLREDRNPGAAEQAWSAVEQFLRREVLR